MDDYRILSLDGGGIWALIQVVALIDLYSASKDGKDITGHEVLKKFDLVAANSGGTLTLGGLIMDWTLSDLLGMFLSDERRKEIFVPATILQDPLAHLTQLAGIGPKYSAKGKYVGLRNILGPVGDTLITDAPGLVGQNYAKRLPQFLFCAFDYDGNRETFFRSDTLSLASSFAPPLPVTIAQAIHASANPPVNYFDAPANLAHHRRFWDGAIGGYNNPVLAAVVEVLANAGRYNTVRSAIRALSIGTANVVLPMASGDPHEDHDLVAPLPDSTILGDLKIMATSILDDPPDAATFHAHIMLGGPLPANANDPPAPSPVVRLNPLIQPVAGATGGWDFPPGLPRHDFIPIRDLPMDATAQDDVLRIQNLAHLWLANDIPNQPVRANSHTLKPEIGAGRYQLARQAIFT